MKKIIKLLIIILSLLVFFVIVGILFLKHLGLSSRDEILPLTFPIEDYIQPTKENPLVILDGSIVIASGDVQEVRVGFFNNVNEFIYANLVIDKCVSTVNTSVDCTGVNLKPDLNSIPYEIGPNKTIGIRTMFSAKCLSDAGKIVNLPVGTYICNLEAVQYDKTNRTNFVAEVYAQNNFIIDVRP